MVISGKANFSQASFEMLFVLTFSDWWVVKVMPARIGEIPLQHLVITRLDANDVKNLDKFSREYGVKRSTMVRLAVREYLTKVEPPAA